MGQQIPVRKPDSLPHETEPAEWARDERWALVTRTVSGRSFAKATQLKDLLLYVARVAITDPTHDITEQELGAHVLGRRPDYDPQVDTIVRVQMRHLRERLQKHFASDGHDEPVRIVIPKGIYLPRFEPYENPAVALPAVPPRALPWRWIVAAALTVVAAFALGRVSINWKGAPSAVDAELVANPVLARLFVRDQPTNIVIADSSTVLVQDVLHLDLSLDDYISRSYHGTIDTVPDAGLRSALRLAARRQYTSLADATLSCRLFAIGTQAGAKPAVRFSRHLNVRDFNSGNFILVGSRRGIVWNRLFESQLNFRLAVDGDASGFVNLKARPGEPDAYPVRPVQGPYQTYATVALLPNLAGNGVVLLLNGATMEASEAAGEFLLRADFASTVSRLIGASTADRGTYFEILLQISASAGAPSDVRVMAWRRPAK